MAPLPHYLRFARAAALVTGLAATPGCYASHVRDGDAPDAAVPDADAWVDPCRSCTCDRLGSPGSCSAQGLFRCCPITGPLAPPDLSNSA